MGLTVSDIAALGPDAQKQIYDKMLRHNPAPEKKKKYNNVPDARGDIRFDSKKEARRYDELMLRLRAGEIRDLKLQPQFTLSEAYTTPEGKRVRAIRYVADFSYYERYEDEIAKLAGFDCESWRPVVEDVKSRATKTRVYAIKKKLLLEKYEIEVTEI